MPSRARVTLNMDKLLDIQRNTNKRVDDVLLEMAIFCEGEAKTSMGTGPAGRTYTRGGTDHVASAPPGPPNVDTGTLWNSIQGKKDGPGRAVTDVGAEHGLYQEFGTKNMAARPFLLPAFMQTVQEIRKRGWLKRVVE